MDEIEALRAFRAHLDQPPAALERTVRTASFASVAGGPAIASGSRTTLAQRIRLAGTWRPLIVGSVAVATALSMVAIGVITREARGPSSVGTPTGPASPTVTATVTDPQAILELLAGIAEQGPAQPIVKKDQVVVITTHRWPILSPSEPSPYVSVDPKLPPAVITERVRVEPNGLIVFEHELYGHRETFQQYVRDQRAQFAHDGPSITQPSPAWLAHLNVDPSYLRSLLVADAPCRERSCLNAEWQLWNRVTDLVRQADVLLPPKVRAGLLRVLATVPRVDAQRITLNGRDLYAISFPFERIVAALYVDPHTARIVGAGTVETGPINCPSDPATESAGPTARPACSVVVLSPRQQRHLEVTFWTTELHRR